VNKVVVLVLTLFVLGPISPSAASGESPHLSYELGFGDVLVFRVNATPGTTAKMDGWIQLCQASNQSMTGFQVIVFEDGTPRSPNGFVLTSQPIGRPPLDYVDVGAGGVRGAGTIPAVHASCTWGLSLNDWAAEFDHRYVFALFSVASHAYVNLTPLLDANVESWDVWIGHDAVLRNTEPPEGVGLALYWEAIYLGVRARIDGTHDMAGWFDPTMREDNDEQNYLAYGWVAGNYSCRHNGAECPPPGGMRWRKDATLLYGKGPQSWEFDVTGVAHGSQNAWLALVEFPDDDYI
jgi:hypothetical protein